MKGKEGGLDPVVQRGEGLQLHGARKDVIVWMKKGKGNHETVPQKKRRGIPQA
jgi:hypothetical protein